MTESKASGDEAVTLEAKFSCDKRFMPLVWTAGVEDAADVAGVDGAVEWAVAFGAGCGFTA